MTGKEKPQSSQPKPKRLEGGGGGGGGGGFNGVANEKSYLNTSLDF
jgi:hypothetical protein